MSSTRERASDFRDGDKLYQRRARRALPILVRQAQAARPIYYSDLAEELGMPNPRNLNYVLGSVGVALEHLSGEWNAGEVPPIQALVCNKETGLPGVGLGTFVRDQDFENASPTVRRRIVDGMLGRVYAYPNWVDVLEHFALEPIDSPPSQIGAQQARGGEETKEHRRLKYFVAAHPAKAKLKISHSVGRVEYPLRSGDSLDVLFDNDGSWVGVEVKARNASVAEVVRGLYQCVKYQAVLEAMAAADQTRADCRTRLVLEQEFPRSLIGLRNTLGVQVISGITVPDDFEPPHS